MLLLSSGPDLDLFDTFKKRVFFEQVKLKVQFIYLTAIY